MKLRKTDYLVLVLSLTVLVGVLFFNQHVLQGQTDHMPQPTQKEPLLPDVEVMVAEEGQYAMKVRGFGDSKMHFTLSLTSQDSGQVVAISENLEAGCRVKKGAVLVQIDDTDYLAAVADAKSELATARLALLEEEREASQAQTEWKASGFTGQPDSALVLHKPYLVAAQATVEKAETALASADKNLALTQITAPFDAIVGARIVVPGSYLQEGTEVATLYSTDLIEIAVPLPVRDWSNLPDIDTLINGRWPVEITGVENGQTWQGRVLRAQQHINETSRQRILYIAVDAPLDLGKPLLPGTFVGVEIEGNTLDNVWKLKSSSLSQKGEIWFLSDTNSLGKFSSEPLFSDDGFIYIKVPQRFKDTNTQVVVHPLSSYLPGMKVQPVFEGDNA